MVSSHRIASRRHMADPKEQKLSIHFRLPCCTVAAYTQRAGQHGSYLYRIPNHPRRRVGYFSVAVNACFYMPGKIWAQGAQQYSRAPITLALLPLGDTMCTGVFITTPGHLLPTPSPSLDTYLLHSHGSFIHIQMVIQ